MTKKKLVEPEKNPNAENSTPSTKVININLTAPEFTRLANNFYNSVGIESHEARINLDSQLINYFLAQTEAVKQKKRVAFVWICLNPPYWEFAKPMIEGARRFFLPGHDVDYFLWSDMPATATEAEQQILGYLNTPVPSEQAEAIKRVAQDVASLHQMERVTIFPLEGIEWPMPTLLRYHTFLQQEEILANYDYIFYCDVDMQFVNVVGDEILGSGLTAGVNPMYYLDNTMYPPYEPNPESAAYIPRPGRVITEAGKARFQPLYYAGGFQGGTSQKFLEAMKIIRKAIDKDLAKNYIAIWNEESHWNRYLFENPPAIVLNPSYIYPDSLIEEYYVPRWGFRYQPKLVTLTKKFSLKQLTPEEQVKITAMKPK